MVFVEKHNFLTAFALMIAVPCVFSNPALAQERDLTPRDRVVSLLLGDQPASDNEDVVGSAALDSADSSPLSPMDSPVIVDAPVANEADVVPQPPLDISPSQEVVAADNAAAEVVAAEIIEPAPSSHIREQIQAPVSLAEVDFAPAKGRSGFFQTAEDYLTARGGDTGPQLKLRYKVVKADAMTGLGGDPEMMTILLGADYAATARGDGPLQIFDFKTRRLLTVTADAQEHFTNVSLYAARYKNIDTVRRMTKGGSLRVLSAPPRGPVAGTPNVPPKALNAFYLESSLGWAAKPLPEVEKSKTALSLTTNDGVTTAQFSGKKVFTGKFNGPDFDVPTQGYSLISLFYHLLPIHPEILATLTQTGAAPTYLKLYTESPNAPSGQTETWTLTDVVADKVIFPLPKTALSVTELPAVSPLAYVMTEALNGRALGGPPDSVATLAAMEKRLNEGDVLAVWLSANAMSDRMGGCKALAGLCEITARAQSLGSKERDLGDLFSAFDDINRPEKRIGALMTLQEAVADPDVPGIILRKMALGLAKLKRKQAITAGFSDLKAETLLTQAIAKDPYDYAAYQGLAQVYAARGDFIESWDMSDALRAFPDAPGAMTAPFDRAEQKLARGAPGFFPPLQP